MNRKILSLLLLASLCLASICTAGAETLIHNFGPSQYAGYEDFMAKHPDVTVEHASVFYPFNTELITGLVTNTMQDDLLYVHSSSHLIKSVMEKGYLTDLSGYPKIVNAVKRMYPAIKAHCMMDGKAYGWPNRIDFNYSIINLDTWAYTGSSEMELPDSYEDVLNWIAWWIDKAEAEDIRDVNVFPADSYQYDKTYYPYCLTNEVLTSHILQQQYAGGTLSFNDPKLREILIRCKELGDRLAQQEVPRGEDDDPIDHRVVFEAGYGKLPKNKELLLPSRLTDDQPKLLDGNLSMVVIPITSQHKELAAELLSDVAEGETVGPNGEPMPTTDRLYLFADAPVPLNPQYEEIKARYEESIAELEDAIAKAEANGKSTDKLAYELAQQRRLLDEQSPYLISPEEMEVYRSVVDGLFFPGPSVFRGRSEDVGAFESLKKQYASGSITVDELLSRLDQMARMMEAEQG